MILLISLAGANTISIDELLQEEEGRAWPRNHQRLDRDSSNHLTNGSSENVERRFSAELVNGANSSLGWSMNGSSEVTVRHNWFTTPSSQIGNDSSLVRPYHWSPVHVAGGVNDLQTAASTESFEVEEVPYSLNAMETLRMVFNMMNTMPLLHDDGRCILGVELVEALQYC